MLTAGNSRALCQRMEFSKGSRVRVRVDPTDMSNGVEEGRRKIGQASQKTAYGSGRLKKIKHLAICVEEPCN